VEGREGTDWFYSSEYLEEEKGLGEGRRNGIAELDDPELPAQGEEQGKLLAWNWQINL
jgi:hypothetical protein